MLGVATLKKHEQSKEETTCLQFMHNSNFFNESYLKRYSVPRKSELLLLRTWNIPFLELRVKILVTLNLAILLSKYLIKLLMYRKIFHTTQPISWNIFLSFHFSTSVHGSYESINFHTVCFFYISFLFYSFILTKYLISHW